MCRMYLFAPPAEWMHRMYLLTTRALPYGCAGCNSLHRQQNGCTGCISLHNKQYGCAGCISLHHQQYGRAGCNPYHWQPCGRAGCNHFNRQQCGCAGFIPLHHKQCGRARCIPFHHVWVCGMYPLLQPAVWVCRVYPFPPCASVQGVSLSTTRAWMCRVYPFPRAGCFFFHLYPVCKCWNETLSGRNLIIPVLEWKKCPCRNQPYWNKGTQYRTELLDTGMPMLVASAWTPMPSYAKNEN